MAAKSHAAGHHHADMWVFPDKTQVTREVSERTSAMPTAVTAGLAVTGILLILGVVGFMMRAAGDGFGEHGPWGYYAAVFAFVFMVTGSAPLAAAIFRVTIGVGR